jgi:hypothetical protein
MTSRLSFLSAVLAAGAFAALPAFAEGTSPAPASVQPPAAQVQPSVKTPAAQASTDAHADVKSDAKKDKLSTEKKKHERIAEHPVKTMKDGANTSTSTNTVGKSEPTKQ